jgi:hypothetical protein
MNKNQLLLPGSGDKARFKTPNMTGKKNNTSTKTPNDATFFS